MFTIGYATKPINTYIEQLQQHLQRAGLRYVYLGAELGPRSKDPAHYDQSNQVQFDRLMAPELYQSGVQRLFDGVGKGFRIAMTCACKNPAICHRSLLVGWSLRHQYDCELQHITHDGALESQSALEQRLMTLTDTVPDLLAREAAAPQLAYQQQCLACAYRRPPEPDSV